MGYEYKTKKKPINEGLYLGLSRKPRSVNKGQRLTESQNWFEILFWFYYLYKTASLSEVIKFFTMHFQHSFASIQNAFKNEPK